jgi:hypothetical protein
MAIARKFQVRPLWNLDLARGTLGGRSSAAKNSVLRNCASATQGLVPVGPMSKLCFDGSDDVLQRRKYRLWMHGRGVSFQTPHDRIDATPGAVLLKVHFIEQPRGSTSSLSITGERDSTPRLGWRVRRSPDSFR